MTRGGSLFRREKEITARKREGKPDFRIDIQRIDLSPSGPEGASGSCVAVAHFTIENRGDDCTAMHWQLELLEAFNNYRPAQGSPIWIYVGGDAELMHKPLDRGGRRVGSVAFEFRDLAVDRASELPQVAWAISCLDGLGNRHTGKWKTK